MVTLYDVLEFLIQKGPGRTEAELAKAIFGEKGYPQLINSDCRRLMHGRKRALAAPILSASSREMRIGRELSLELGLSSWA